MKRFPSALVLIPVIACTACTTPSIRPVGPQPEVAPRQVERPAPDAEPWGNTEAMALYMDAVSLKAAGDLEGALEAATAAARLDDASAELRLLVSEIYSMLRRTDEALQWAEEALAKDPGSVEAMRLIARAASARQETDRAVATYRKIIELEPEDREAYLHLGGLLNEKGRTDEALEVFERYLTVDPGNHIALLYIGRIHFERGDAERARERLEQAVERQPGLVSAWNLLGLARERLRDLPGAADAYARVLERDPHNLSVLKRLSAIELDLGRGEAAERHLRSIVLRDPKDLAARLSLGLHYSRAGEYAKALVEMRAARELTENNLGIDLSIVDLLGELGMEDEAATKLDELFARHPGDPDVIERIASRHRSRKEYDRAIELLRGLLAGETDTPHVRMQISAVYREAKRLEEAKELMTASLEKFPEDPVLLFELAVVLDGLKDFPGTEATLRRTIAAKADHASALNYLGYLYAERGINLTESVDLVKRALAVDPKNGYYLDSLGWAYYKLGRLVEAREQLSRAAEEVPKDPTILDHLGDVCRDLGDLAAALGYWRRSLEVDGGQETVRRKVEETLAAHPELAGPPPGTAP